MSAAADRRSFLTRDRDVVLSEALTFHMREVRHQPRPDHWSRIWPSAIAMSRWLMEPEARGWPGIARELGCGLGLLGMTLAHLGVAVDGTDREPRALIFAAENAARNDTPGLTVSHLDWSAFAGLPASLWLASDILYEPASVGRIYQLLQTGGGLLPLGRLVIGGPVARQELLEDLVAKLQRVGYAAESVERMVEWEGRREAIRIHTLCRPA